MGLTRKDVLFFVFSLLWFVAGMIGIIVLRNSLASAAINYTAVGILCVAVVFKKFTKFGVWLEKPWKKKK